VNLIHLVAAIPAATRRMLMSISPAMKATPMAPGASHRT
jgi:hypothetical protein